jgi:predicted transcriptional regulator
MPVASVKEDARRLVDQLPDDATWEDLMYQVYVRQSVEAGLADARAGRLVSTDDMRRRLGLSA